MKTLYIECNMGAAGDMLMSALLELSENPEGFMEKMNNLGLEDVHFIKKEAVKCGIKGTHMDVHIHGQAEKSKDAGLQAHHHGHASDETHSHSHQNHSAHHSHRGIIEISHIINNLPVSAVVKNHAIAVYNLIAEAESISHGCPVSQVHFHEVGALDAIADIVGVCLLIEELAPDVIIASPVNLGSGMVHCAHGILPVPAPATANLLKGIPSYTSKIPGELCTPTGAALLKHFAHRFDVMPEIAIDKIGYGMGTKDFEAANCVRTFIGRTTDKTSPAAPNGTVVGLSCNLDDMTGEAVGYAINLLFEHGARDVFTIPVTMKKSRPGVLLTCICDSEKADFFAELMLRHTTTFGVRKVTYERYTLSRSFDVLDTAFGEVRIKKGSGYHVEKQKPEYEDMADLAKSNQIALSDVYHNLKL